VGSVNRAIRLLIGVLEFRIGLLDYLREALFEIALRRYAQPSAAQKAFRGGKVQTHEQLTLPSAADLDFSVPDSLGLPFDFPLALEEGAGFSSATVLALVLPRGSGAIEFVEEFLVQAERLLPTVELVTRQLRFFFVRAKVQSDINVRHTLSLRRARS